MDETMMDDMPVAELYTGTESMPMGEIDGTAVAAASAGFGFFMIFYFAIIVLMIVSFWKIFTKAGQPGWASIIPIYNLYIMLKIAGKPGWWVLLFFIPFVNIVFAIIMWIEVSKAFGKSIGYALGLIFLGIIFLPMLAFGDATYTKPVGEGDDENTPPQDPTQTPTSTPEASSEMPQQTQNPTV